MWVWGWFLSLSSEGKALVFTVVGVIAKWWMDRRFIARLRGDIAIKEAELKDKEKKLDKAEDKLAAAQKKIDDLKQALRSNVYRFSGCSLLKRKLVATYRLAPAAFA